MPGWTEAVLRQSRPSLHHLQLLPQASSPFNCSRARPLRPGTRPCPRRIRIQASRLRGHVESRSSSDERAGQGNALNRDANAEAKSFPKNAELQQEALQRTAGISPQRRRTKKVRPSGKSDSMTSMSTVREK